MKRKFGKITALILTGTLLLTGCGAAQTTEESVTDIAQESTAASEVTDADSISGQSTSSQGTSGTDRNASDQTTAVTSTNTTSLPEAADMFTDRDKEVGYDESSDILIQLNGTSASSEADSVQIEGSTVTITDEGTYILSGILENGSIVIEAEDSDKIHLVFNGLSISNASSAALYVKQADKVFVTLAPATENTLSTTGEFAAIDDNNIDSVIFSKDDLTLNGAGSLSISCDYGHGIVSKDDLVITGGTYDMDVSGHGLSGKDSVRILDGTFTITAGEDAIHGDNDEDDTLGYVYVAGGTFEINAGDDGMHASFAMVIDGGNINIAESYEGIEGKSIDINGGSISLKSSDDGLNAAGGNDGSGMAGDWFSASGDNYIRITGGTLYVNASGDGIDSNGSLYVSGGETYVSGPSNSGNGSLDYNGEAQITGGIFVAAGASGMAQNFGSSSTQGAMLVDLSSFQNAGTIVELTDAQGNVLAGFTAQNSYSCVVVSCPEIAEGSTYTLQAGTETVSVEMTSLIYGSGSGMGGGMNGMKGGMNGDMNGMKGGMDGTTGGRGGRGSMSGAEGITR